MGLRAVRDFAPFGTLRIPQRSRNTGRSIAVLVPRHGCSENGDDVLGNDDVVADMRAAQERNSPVVNARNARCQNFLSKFIGVRRAEAGRWADNDGTGQPAGRDSHGEDDRALDGETYSPDRNLSATGQPAIDRVEKK